MCPVISRDYSSNSKFHVVLARIFDATHFARYVKRRTRDPLCEYHATTAMLFVAL